MQILSNAHSPVSTPKELHALANDNGTSMTVWNETVQWMKTYFADETRGTPILYLNVTGSQWTTYWEDSALSTYRTGVETRAQDYEWSGNVVATVIIKKHSLRLILVN